MNDGLEALLADYDTAAVNGLRSVLREYLATHHPDGRLVRQEKIKPSVYRLHFDLAGGVLLWIVKRLEGRIARRNELLSRRWLPSVSLDNAAQPLLATAGTIDGKSVWHIYQDLGPWSLAETATDTLRLQAAIKLLAEIHTRFTAHPYLAEARLFGGDLGTYFIVSNLSDAIMCLEKAVQTLPETPQVVEHLLDRLIHFRSELPERLALIREMAGSETLLHGDLWTSNVFVLPDGQACLIDWDHVAVGPPAYDLSTFVLRFPPDQRRLIVEVYRHASPYGDWQIPGFTALNQIFETFEIARFSCRIIWPAIALWESGAAWAIDVLADIESWFLNLQAIFPDR